MQYRRRKKLPLFETGMLNQLLILLTSQLLFFKKVDSSDDSSNEDPESDSSSNSDEEELIIELDRYLKSAQVKDIKDPLHWWMNNQDSYPRLLWMARDF